MTIDRTDKRVFGLAALIVATLVTTAAGWGAPLIGDSRRWATLVVLILATAAGWLSAPGSDSRSYVLGALVLVAFLFAVMAFATASLTMLVLLVASVLALIAVSVAHHAREGRGQHAPAMTAGRTA